MERLQSREDDENDKLISQGSVLLLLSNVEDLYKVSSGSNWRPRKTEFLLNQQSCLCPSYNITSVVCVQFHQEMLKSVESALAPEPTYLHKIGDAFLKHVRPLLCNNEWHFQMYSAFIDQLMLCKKHKLLRVIMAHAKYCIRCFNLWLSRHRKKNSKFMHHIAPTTRGRRRSWTNWPKIRNFRDLFWSVITFCQAIISEQKPIMTQMSPQTTLIITSLLRLHQPC